MKDPISEITILEWGEMASGRDHVVWALPVRVVAAAHTSTHEDIISK